MNINQGGVYLGYVGTEAALVAFCLQRKLAA